MAGEVAEFMEAGDHLFWTGEPAVDVQVFEAVVLERDAVQTAHGELDHLYIELVAKSIEVAQALGPNVETLNRGGELFQQQPIRNQARASVSFDCGHHF